MRACGAGVATIRAYRREDYFTAASDALMELNAAAFVSQRAASAWLAVRLDLLGVVVITLTAVLSISGGITPALAGLCLVYALDLTRFLKYGTAMAAKTGEPGWCHAAAARWCDAWRRAWGVLPRARGCDSAPNGGRWGVLCGRWVCR